MARIRPPGGSAVFLDHQPEQYGAFNRLYGTLWSDGVLDQATKARLDGLEIRRHRPEYGVGIRL